MIFRIACAAATIALFTVSCGDSVSVSVDNGPYFQDAWLSSDPEGKNRVTSFAANDTVHAKADLASANAGTVVSVRLIAEKVDYEGLAPDTEIGGLEQVYDGKHGRMNFDFSNDGPMPSGSYRVELSIDGKDAQTLQFTIPAG